MTSVSRPRASKAQQELSNPSSVVFNRSSILLVVCHERARNCSSDRVWRRVSQTWSEGERLLFACACRQGALRDVVARQDNWLTLPWWCLPSRVSLVVGRVHGNMCNPRYSELIPKKPVRFREKCTTLNFLAAQKHTRYKRSHSRVSSILPLLPLSRQYPIVSL